MAPGQDPQRRRPAPHPPSHRRHRRGDPSPHRRLRKQERAQETRRRRADPHGNLRDAIATYPLDAVLEAISIFEGKLLAQTLPPGAEGRYLLGIARNLAHEHEALEIAQALWKSRSAARDHAFRHLLTQPPPAAEPLFHFAAQRIAATFRVSYGERLQALRFLAARILPLHHLHDVA